MPSPNAILIVALARARARTNGGESREKMRLYSPPALIAHRVPLPVGFRFPSRLPSVVYRLKVRLHRVRTCSGSVRAAANRFFRR